MLVMMRQLVVIASMLEETMKKEIRYSSSQVLFACIEFCVASDMRLLLFLLIFLVIFLASS